MPNTPKDLLNYIRVVVGAWRDDPRDDDQLLTRFVETRDDAAFTTLLWRHGPMIWRTCKRVLGDGPDAEDAFQATYLTLTRKASGLHGSTLAGWLHRVARQAALDVRAKARRRRNLEQQISTAARPEAKDVGQTEQYAVVDEELAGLPEKLRVPLVLRYLEGKTQEEVARILGCSRSVALKRLGRGEALLRERLEQRGLVSGTVAALLGNSSTSQAVPADLIASTAQAALAFRAGTLSGVAADGAQRLLRALMVEKTVRTGWWLVLIGICAFGTFGTGLTIWRMITKSFDVMDVSALPSAVSSPPVASVSQAVDRGPRVDIYGDPLPEGALARLGTVRLRDIGMIAPLAFMPDGKAIVSVTRKRLIMWEFPSGKRLKSLCSCEDTEVFTNVHSISADGKLMAIAKTNGAVELFDLHAGRQVGLLQSHTEKEENVLALAFISDGKILASGMRDKTVRFWDVANCKELRRQNITLSDPRQQIVGMAFAPDARTVAVGQRNGLVRLLDLESGTPGNDIKISTKADSLSVTFSADGRKLVAAGSDGWVTLWDVAARKKLLRLRGHEGVQTVQLSPDGKILAASGNDEKKKIGEVHLWDAETGVSLSTLTGPHQFAIFMAFSPNSKTLVTGTFAQTLKLWDVSTGKPLPSPEGHAYGVNAIAFTPDGKSLVSGNQNPEGMFSIGNSTILMWNIETCKPRSQQVECKSEEKLRDAFAYSLDGKILASVGRDEKNQDIVLLWDTITGKRLRALKGFTEDQGYVNVMAFAPDNKKLAIGDSESGNVELHDVATGKRLCSLVADNLKGKQRNRVAALAFSVDGRKLASAHPAEIAIWDAVSGKQLHSLVIPLQNEEAKASVSSLAFSPDGRLLVSGGDSDKTLRLWEVCPGQEILKVPLEEGGIQVAFSPDGRLIASSSEDETVRLWDTVSGRQLHQFPRGQGRAQSIAFSPSGKTLASGNQDTTVLIWDVAPWTGKDRRPTVLSPDELQASWSALTDADAGKAYRALGKLVEATDRAVPLLAEQLRSTAVASQRVDRLVADLNNDDFQIRNRSREELQKIAADAEPILRHALKGNLSLEQRHSVEELLGKWNANGVSLKFLQKLRGVAALEYIGTNAARQALQELVELLTHDEVGDEARAALQRLSLHPR